MEVRRAKEALCYSFRSSYSGVHFRCGLIVQPSIVLSGTASRLASVIEAFGRESSNSGEQTFTAVIASFMVAHAKVATSESEGDSRQVD